MKWLSRFLYTELLGVRIPLPLLRPTKEKMTSPQTNLVAVSMDKVLWDTLIEELEATIYGYSSYKSEETLVFINSLINILDILKNGIKETE